MIISADRLGSGRSALWVERPLSSWRSTCASSRIRKSIIPGPQGIGQHKRMYLPPLICFPVLEGV